MPTLADVVQSEVLDNGRFREVLLLHPSSVRFILRYIYMKGFRQSLQTTSFSNTHFALNCEI